MLANVQQATIKPVITAAVTPGTLVHTDEYAIYARLPAWGYEHKTVCHAHGEYVRDEDGGRLLRGPRQHDGRILVAAALLAASAPGHLTRQAAALSRVLSVHAQRATPRQSPARSLLHNRLRERRDDVFLVRFGVDRPGEARFDRCSSTT